MNVTIIAGFTGSLPEFFGGGFGIWNFGVWNFGGGFVGHVLARLLAMCWEGVVTSVKSRVFCDL